MSVPNVIFIDTSIFDEQNYNFASAAFAPFVEAVKGKGLTLLIPDPTRREIYRHIRAKSQAVIRALEEAKRQAPFLEKWKSWPLTKDTTWRVSSELSQLAYKELQEFLGQFKPIELAYEGVNLRDVMDWYDAPRAPFSAKKRKEFPDAFALASLLSYARKEHVSVAVVSKDSDFHAACGLYTELLHYNSLAAITEALLSSDARVGRLKALLDGEKSKLGDAVAETFANLGFYLESEPSGDVEDVEIVEVTVDELRVVHIGESECSVAFEAEVAYSAHARYKDSSDWPSRVYSGQISDTATIDCVAKLAVNETWDKIVSVGAVDVGVSDIAVAELPDEYEREDDDYLGHYEED